MKLNQMKFGIYLTYVSLFLTNITNLVLTPFILKNLGQAEYGLYTLIGAFVGYLAVLDFGLGNTIVRFVTKYRVEKDKKGEENFLFLTLVIYSIISLLILVIGTIIYFNLDNIFSNSLTAKEIELAKVMFIILIVNLAFTLPMKSFTGIITAYEKFVFPRIITISRTVLRALVIFLLLSLGYKALAIVVVDAILNLLMMIISMCFVFLKLKVRIILHKFDGAFMKEICSYSSLIFVSVVVDQIYWRIGQLVLGVVASTSEVAIFAIGMLFAQYFITFSTAISGVFLPKITKMVIQKATGEELTDLLIKTGRLQLIMLGFVLGGFVLLGNKFITLWVGTGFKISWVIGLIVMIPLLVVLTQTIGISILQAKNMHGFRAISYLCISIVNLFISIFLAKKYGAVGAGFGTTLSLIFGNILAMNLYYHFKVNLNIPRFYKELFRGLLKSMLISIVLGLVLLFFFSNSWYVLIIQGIFYGIIYMAAMWFLGMNNYEKGLFSNEFSKLRKLLPR